MSDPIAIQGVILGLLMLSAHLFGRLTMKLKIGQMIGQLLGGVFVGPYFLEMIGLFDKLHLQSYHQAFDTFHFIIFTFLGVIAFALGEELHIDRLRKIGSKAALISLIQAGLTWVLLTGLFLIVEFPWPFALIIGCIGVATAPAITFVLLNHFEIEGRFRNMVANMLVLGDVLEIILFSIFVQIAAMALHSGKIDVMQLLRHLGTEFGLALLIGFGIFLFLKITVRRSSLPKASKVQVTTLGPGFLSRILSVHPTPSLEILVIVIGTVAIGSGLGLGLNIPFLITGIFAGVLIANFHTHALFDSLKIDNVMPLLNLVFFAMIGANIKLDVFGGDHLWLVAGYVGVRGFAKIFGTYIGCKITKQDPKVTSCLPFLMLPQAGVAAVEAVYVIKLFGDQGNLIANVVLPAIVIFEITGVFLSERSLLKWRQWTMGEAKVLSPQEKALRESLAPGQDLFSNLAKYVPKGHADFKLKSKTLAGAIEELATSLEKSGHIVEDQTVVERSMSREKMGSTALGYGLAIPHCKVLGLTRIVCAIGYLEEPLEDTKGPDKVPVTTIILIVSPMQHPEGHLKALSTIANIFSNDNFRETFVNAMAQGDVEKLLRLSTQKN